MTTSFSSGDFPSPSAFLNFLGIVSLPSESTKVGSLIRPLNYISLFTPIIVYNVFHNGELGNRRNKGLVSGVT